MTTLSPDRWTPIAIRLRTGYCDAWSWERSVSETEIRRAHDADDIIVMHSGDLLVARIAGPHWKRLRRQMRRGRI